ncbi:Chaperone protein dnaJ 13 [Galdieria sulphuraria]|nr:Chaperone protein dnaJ 13 [Galdieria sulphuraria]
MTKPKIKNAYRRLCQTYHPDKHLSPDLKKKATERFTVLNEAFEILSDPEKRRIYDEFGMEGIRAVSNSLVKYEDIKARFQQSGRVTGGSYQKDNSFIVQNTAEVLIDATGIAVILEDLSEEEDYFVAPFAVSQLSLATRATVVLSRKDFLTFQYHIQSRRKMSTHGLTITTRRQFSSNSYGEISYIISSQRSLLEGVFSWKLWRRLSERSTGMIEGSYSSVQAQPLLAVTNTRQLSPNTSAQLTWTAGLAPGVLFAFQNSQDSGTATGSMKLGMLDTSVSFGYRKLVGQNGHWKARGRWSIRGWELEVGIGRDLFSYEAAWSVSVRVGLDGIILKCKVGRSGHQLQLPILVVAHPSPLGIIAPYQYKMDARRKQKEKEERLEKRMKERNDALTALELMKPAVERCRSREENVPGGGLIIIRALYGSSREISILSIDSTLENTEQVADVSDALQYFVEDSRLTLYATTKARLMGFWDPTIDSDEKKVLHIWYKFKNALHECEVDDFLPVELPLLSHRYLQYRSWALSYYCSSKSLSCWSKQLMFESSRNAEVDEAIVVETDKLEVVSCLTDSASEVVDIKI